LLGSSVDYSLRTNFARNVIGNTDEQASLIWRCEPQPYPRAVVSFYTDLRDPEGKAGRRPDFIDPINNGAHLSLYYCNQTPVGGSTGRRPAHRSPSLLQRDGWPAGSALHLRATARTRLSHRQHQSRLRPQPALVDRLRAGRNYDQGVDGPSIRCSTAAPSGSPSPRRVVLTSSAGDVVDLSLAYINSQDIP